MRNAPAAASMFAGAIFVAAVAATLSIASAARAQTTDQAASPMPAPAPNYGVAPPPAAVALLQELATLRAQQQGHSDAVPILSTVGLVVGTLGFVLGGLVWLVAALSSAVGVPNNSFRDWMGAFTLGSFGVIVLGIVGLVIDGHDRSEVNARIQSVQQQLFAFGIRAALDVTPLPGGALGRLSLDF